MKKLQERIGRWIAWHLPDSLVMWCSIRLMAFATQGIYSSQVVPELTAMDALNRWIYKERDEARQIHYEEDQNLQSPG